jgi:hypothetical protein
MNHINSIAAVNVKGRNFRHLLRPLTIIAGDNATGKTAITDALQIALLGYLPALGKQPGKTMELAPDTAKQMEIEAEFSEGGKIRRTFNRTRTGAGVEASGQAPDVSAAQLSFGEFLNAKPTERHAILASLMGAIDYPALAEQAKAEMARLGLLELISLTFDPQADKPMDAAIESLASQGKAIKQTIDQNRKTLATMAMAQAPDKVGADVMASHDASLQDANLAVGKATATLDELNDRLQRAPDEPQDRQPTTAEIELAQSELVEAVEALREAKAQAKARSEITLQLEEADNRRKRLEPKAAGSRIGFTEPSKSREDLNLEAAKAARALQDDTDRHVKLNLELGAATETCKATSEQLDQLKSGTCPCCGNAGAGLEAAMDAMKARQSAAADEAAMIEARINLIQADIASSRTRIKDCEEITRDIDAWEAKVELETVNATIVGLRAKLVVTNSPTAAATAMEQADKRLQALRATDQEWIDYKKDAGTAPTPDAILAARNDLTHAITQRDMFRDNLQRARAANAQYDAYQADQNRAIALQEETDSTEKAAKGIGELRTFLQQAQRDAVAESMKPLISTAGIFMAGLVAGEMATEAHRVGIRRGDAFLPLEVLSGMEMIAVSTACQAALASQSGIRILIVDELARMTPGNRKTFVGNCKAAILAGIVDQIVLIDQSDAGTGEYTILV